MTQNSSELGVTRGIFQIMFVISSLEVVSKIVRVYNLTKLFYNPHQIPTNFLMVQKS